MIKSLVILLMASTFLITSCSTTVPVKVRKPAELNIGSARTIAVMDFDFEGSIDFSGDKSKDRVLSGALLGMLKNALQKKFDAKNAYPGSSISDRLTAQLVQNGYYTVIERSMLEDIMKEQALSLSGMVNEQQAVAVGNLVGAQALITGSGVYRVNDEGGWEKYTEEKKNKEGKKIKVEKERYNIIRNVNVEITFRIIDVSNGTVITSKTNKGSNNGKDKTSADNEKGAANKLTDWKPIVDDLVAKIINLTVKQIAPHTVSEKRIIEEGESKKMERAVEFAERDLWEDAKKIWDEVISNNKSEKDDKVAANYNIGLYYEVFGFLDDADGYYQKAYDLSKDSKFLDARSRIKKRKDELIKLYQQEHNVQ